MPIHIMPGYIWAHSMGYKTMRVPFNIPSGGDAELAQIAQAIANRHISGGGDFGAKAESLLAQQLGLEGRVMLTTSCTHALEMAAILLDLQPGDEIIFPSYTFVSTALAFVMHGATPVFGDIRSDTLNLDESKIEALITPRTRAIVPVHYAGVGCEMDEIMAIAENHGLIVIEDNAHGLYGKYRGRNLGSFGHMAAQSFHETKNINCGEGGALILNAPEYIQRAEIIRDKGTDRNRFYRGEIDKYTWVDYGSSYCLSDMLAAFLTVQLDNAKDIQERRKILWQRYYEGLKGIAERHSLKLPYVPEHCDQAYHMFYLLLPNLDARTEILNYLKKNEVIAVFHYNSLHQTKMGSRLSKLQVDCPVADLVSDTIIRLPFFLMEEEMQDRVIKVLENYW